MNTKIFVRGQRLFKVAFFSLSISSGKSAFPAFSMKFRVQNKNIITHVIAFVCLHCVHLCLSCAVAIHCSVILIGSNTIVYDICYHVKEQNLEFDFYSSGECSEYLASMKLD